MNLRWDLDRNVIELKISRYSKTRLTVDGNEIPASLSLRRKSQALFTLPDGQLGEISTKRQLFYGAEVTLRVAGKLMVPTYKTPPTCSSCEAVVKPNDSFCTACGKAMPPPENYLLRNSVRSATNMIWVLAAIFAVSGLIVFFAAQSKAEKALARLYFMNPDAPFPTPINGVTYTVAGLRHQIVWEEWSALVVNLILAGVMVGLALWGRIAPLAAILVAAAVYAVVTVTNAIISPQTIAQGIYLKILVVLLLARGIKSALALRTANA